MRKEKRKIRAVIGFSILLLCLGKKQELLSIWNVTKMYFSAIPTWLNTYCINLNNGEGLVTTLVKHGVIFSIVGIVFRYITFNKMNKYVVGKACYWLTDKTITPLLNKINNVIFK